MEKLFKQLQFNQQILNGQISLKNLNDELDTRTLDRDPIDIFDE